LASIFSRAVYFHFRKHHHVIKAERAQTKSGKGAIGYRRILP